MNPAMVHFGQVPLIRQQLQIVLDSAYAAHPERFVRKPPKAPQLQQEAWISKAQKSQNGSQYTLRPSVSRFTRTGIPCEAPNKENEPTEQTLDD